MPNSCTTEVQKKKEKTGIESTDNLRIPLFKCQRSDAIEALEITEINQIQKCLKMYDLHSGSGILGRQHGSIR